MTKSYKFLILPLAMVFMAFGSIGQASAQTVAPKLAIQLASNGLTNPLVSGGNGTVARLLLDTTASTEGVRLTNLPFNVVTGSGALTGSLDNCRVYNESAINTALSSNATATTSLSSGLNTVSLDAPLVLPAGTLTTLALRCDVDSSIVAGGTYTFTMNSANVSGTGVTSGLPAQVTIRGAAVIPPVMPPVVPPVTPGFPSTGQAGDAARNILIMLGSVSIAALGFHFARKQSIKA